MIQLSLCWFTIHHHSFSEFRACIWELAKLANVVREVIQEMHLQKAEIWFINKKLCNFLADLRIIITDATMLWRHRKIAPSAIIIKFLLSVHSKLTVQAFWDLLCRYPGVEWTEHILVTMKLSKIVLHVLNRGFSMILVLCHKVVIH